MEHENKESKKPSGSCCYRFIILLIGLTICYFVVGYKLAHWQPHQDVPHPLAQIYDSESHQTTLKIIRESKSHKILLRGSNESEIYHFLNHYADLRVREGKRVVLRQVDNDLYEALMIQFLENKQLIDNTLGLGSPGPTEWIIVVHGRIESIEKQVETILSQNEQDRIIVASNDLQLSGFEVIDYESIEKQKLSQILEKSSAMDKKIKLLLRFLRTSEQILSAFEENPVNDKKILGDFYYDMSTLSKQDHKRLEEICQKGFVSKKLEEKIPSLEKAGVFFYRKKGFWKFPKNRLNYQLWKEVECLEKEANPNLIMMMENPQYAEERRKKQHQSSTENAKNQGQRQMKRGGESVSDL